MEVSNPPEASALRASLKPTDVTMSTPIDRELVVKDTISGLSDPLSSMSSISSLISLLTIAYQSEPHSPRKEDRLLTLLHTISRSPIPENPNGHTHIEKVNSFIHFLNPVLSGMAGMEDFEAAVEGFSRPDDFSDFWTLEGRNLMRDFIQDGGSGYSMDGFDIPFLDVFVSDPSCRVAYGRDTGELVLVPGTAQVGDEAQVERGDLQPRVIRKQQSI